MRADLPRYFLTITCPGRTGLVAAITGFLAEHECFITELSQFDDLQTGRFFCRAEFRVPSSTVTHEVLDQAFAPVGGTVGDDVAIYRSNNSLSNLGAGLKI